MRLDQERPLGLNQAADAGIADAPPDRLIGAGVAFGVETSPSVRERTRRIEGRIGPGRDHQGLAAPGCLDLLRGLQLDPVEQLGLHVRVPSGAVPPAQRGPAAGPELLRREEPVLEPHVRDLHRLAAGPRRHLHRVEGREVAPDHEPEVHQPYRNAVRLEVVHLHDERSRHRIAEQIVERPLGAANPEHRRTLLIGTHAVLQERGGQRDVLSGELHPVAKGLRID